MDWYIKKSDGSVYGPVDVPTLQYWAIEGRIAPEDEISQNQDHWQPAPEHADLHMDWFLMFDDNEHYGPVHLLALRHMITSGELDPHTPIAHRNRAERHEAGRALLTAMINHNQHLHEDLKSASENIARLEHERAAAAPAPVVRAADGTHFQDTIRERDSSMKEAARWQGLFETEQQRVGEAEARYEQDIRAARLEAVEATTRIEKLRLQLDQANKRLDVINRAADQGDPEANHGAQINAMMDSYNELSRSYDILLNQLRSKNEEIQIAQRARSTIESRADERVRQMQEQLRREQEEADKARINYAEIEESHLQLVRSYRELNDRYIRLRQNMPPLETIRSSAPSSTTDTARSADEKDPDGDDWQPRVRLKRS